MSKRTILILTGYNDRGVLAFCRFCRQNEIPFYLIISNEEERITYEAYGEQVLGIEPFSNKTDFFIKYKEEIWNNTPFREILILPVTEFLSRFLVGHRRQLEAEGFIIPLCPEELYADISDKYRFGLMCRQAGIEVPKEFGSKEELSIPFVAKPKTYYKEGRFINEKPILVLDHESLMLLRHKERVTDFYYQEYLSGESYYLLYYFSKDGSFDVFSQQNLIQQANGGSIIAASSSMFHRHEIAQSFADLFISHGFKGLLMLELRVCGDKVYMIEANPRLWGPAQLILDAGMNLFHRFAFDYGLLATMPALKYYPRVKYFWSGGIFEDQLQQRETAFHAYTKEAFFDNYTEWCKADVYLRPDTQHTLFTMLQH